MADKVDMSLDDIIKLNKKGKKNLNQGKQRTLGKQNKNIAMNIGKKGMMQTMRGPKKGGVVKRRRSDGGAPNYKSKSLANALRHHTKMIGANNKIVPNATRKRSLSESGSSTKLLISNLDFGVSSHDIKELFAEFGPLKKAVVHFDESGKSRGSAEVIFEKKNDAIKAKKQYNNVNLDGRSMNIELVGDFSAMRVTAISRLGQKMNIRGGGQFRRGGKTRGDFTKGGIKNKSARGGGNPNRGRGRGRGGKNTQEKPPTKDELDAQLDAYTNAMDTE